MKYYFEKKVFRYACLILLVYVGALFLILDDTSGIYYVCPEHTSFCENPFYDQCSKYPDICNDELFPAGFTYGGEPGFFVVFADIIFVGIILVAFVINHLLYNRAEVEE